MTLITSRASCDAKNVWSNNWVIFFFPLHPPLHFNYMWFGLLGMYLIWCLGCCILGFVHWVATKHQVKVEVGGQKSPLNFSLLYFFINIRIFGVLVRGGHLADPIHSNPLLAWGSLPCLAKATTRPIKPIGQFIFIATHWPPTKLYENKLASSKLS